MIFAVLSIIAVAAIIFLVGYTFIHNKKKDDEFDHNDFDNTLK